MQIHVASKAPYTPNILASPTHYTDATRSDIMSRRPAIRREDVLTITNDAVCHLLNCPAKPHVSRTILDVVSCGDAIHSSLLFELRGTLVVGTAQSVNTESLPSLAVDQREARYVTRSVRDLDHVLHRYPPLTLRYKGINLDILVLVYALVDLEDCPSFAGVVDCVADLREHFSAKCADVFFEAGGCSLREELTSPDAIDRLGQTRTLNH